MSFSLFSRTFPQKFPLYFLISSLIECFISTGKLLLYPWAPFVLEYFMFYSLLFLFSTCSSLHTWEFQSFPFRHILCMLQVVSLVFVLQWSLSFTFNALCKSWLSRSACSCLRVVCEIAYWNPSVCIQKYHSQGHGLSFQAFTAIIPQTYFLTFHIAYLNLFH